MNELNQIATEKTRGETEERTPLSRSSILNDLKSDKQMSERNKTKLDTLRRKWIEEYDGKPYGNEVKGRSQIISRDIKKSAEWQRASLLDPFVSSPKMVKCDPITYEDKPSADQAQALLNYQFCRTFNRYNFMDKAIKVLQREGTVVVRTGWEYEEEVVEEMVPQPPTDIDMVIAQMNGVPPQQRMGLEEVTKVLVNKPTAVVIDNLDLYIDPTCTGDIKKADFVIHRFQTNISDLKLDGRYENLDEVESWMTEKEWKNSPYELGPDEVFQFSDMPRRKLTAYEYWGNYDLDQDGIAEPIVATWVGNTLIRLEENPYPGQEIPFVSAAFGSSPFSLYGEANAENISPHQKVKTGIQRAIIDNMSQSTNAQKGIKANALDPLNRKRFLNGKNFEFQGDKSDFFEGSFNQIPGSVMEFFNVMTYDIESLTGIKSFSNGGIGGSSLGQTATGAQGILDSTARRELDIVRNISENIVKPLLRKWLAYDTEFLEPEEVVRVTESEYVEISRDDLSTAVDIEISVSTAESDATKAQEIAFMLQTIGPNEDPQVKNMLLAELFELRKMPELAEKIKNYQPQPDPYMEEMKALELELKKAEIADKYARAGENEVDRDLKAAKARNENTKADLGDQQFLDNEDGINRKYDAMMQENKNQHELELAALGSAGKREQIAEQNKNKNKV